MKNLIYKTISTLLSLFIALLALFIIYVSFSESNKSMFGYRVFTVRTGSMSPAMEAGEFIITKKTSAENLKAGDIITFYSKDTEILGAVNTHRIWDAGDGFFITKGDANESMDETPVLFGQVIGKVVFHNGLTGKLVSILKKPLYMVMLIIIPVILVSFSDIAKTFRKLRLLLKKSDDDNDEGIPSDPQDDMKIEEQIHESQEQNTDDESEEINENSGEGTD